MKAKKSFGQHFLKNTYLTANMAKIVSEWNHVPNLLEVGPGRGILTKELIRLDKKFRAVELDRDMIAYLKDQHLLADNELIEQDILKLDMKEVFQGEPFLLVGNFPYNISSRIVIKMLQNKNLIPAGLGMFQYEMAKRIVGKVNTKDYGSLAILTQVFYDAKIVYKVKPGDFSPPPNVLSAVVRFERKNEDPGISFHSLEKVVRSAFTHRRKKLRNNFSDPVLKQKAEEMNLNDLRGEQVKMETFVDLAKKVEEVGK
ncbi:16S rRNA (adenine(1518)-N(6)/adenine(1519)-N(6))-dimethyltransferase RsmA [Membranihabitans maritimus]|uniref:16S rRNA (adenine(1518)-N(6)/adenine(1519)-N(6))- dimethyltransferase RsmA n=1 Tax=Membranihabitans maritimus TaxID=2904244 RepID=UPI001F011CA7|nr:16S rRNA (adenine(1518)-N(6)/adenine(1519)-N(6))-dimethyltransferase RsmA [Membranihabitans maritimus]